MITVVHVYFAEKNARTHQPRTGSVVPNVAIGATKIAPTLNFVKITMRMN